ncbi:MAG: Gfo/Idh/MocA family protein [Verrucomicrobiia bacterium]
MGSINIGIIGCGGITLQNHIPGFKLCPDTKIIGICDTNPELLKDVQSKYDIPNAVTDFKEFLQRDDIEAVVIATPNCTHYEIAMAAINFGKHVLCEKPIAMSYSEAKAMAEAAKKTGVRNMTAFTYRFVPAMRYMRELVKQGFIGVPYNFRSCRLQDWGDRYLGWRQIERFAGTGELGDMLSHRIDFAHILVGDIDQLVANMKTVHKTRGGIVNELDDWVGVIAEFKNGATGMLESSKLATGRGESWRSLDYVEINGSEGTIVYLTEKWNELLVSKKGESELKPMPVPEKFWKLPGSKRNPLEGNPLISFRYDQAFEFVDAIRNNRDCDATFEDGAKEQAVMDAVVKSTKTRRWVKIKDIIE